MYHMHHNYINTQARYTRKENLMQRRRVERSDLAQPGEDGVKALAKVPVYHGGEDLVHGAVVKRLDGHDVEVTGEPTRDVVAASPRRTHCSHHELGGGGGGGGIITWKDEMGSLRISRY